MNPAVVICINPMKAIEVIILSVSGWMAKDSNDKGKEIVQNSTPKINPFA